MRLVWKQQWDAYKYALTIFYSSKVSFQLSRPPILYKLGSLAHTVISAGLFPFQASWIHPHLSLKRQITSLILVPIWSPIWFPFLSADLCLWFRIFLILFCILSLINLRKCYSVTSWAVREEAMAILTLFLPSFESSKFCQRFQHESFRNTHILFQSLNLSILYVYRIPRGQRSRLSNST